MNKILQWGLIAIFTIIIISAVVGSGKKQSTSSITVAISSNIPSPLISPSPKITLNPSPSPSPTFLPNPSPIQKESPLPSPRKINYKIAAVWTVHSGEETWKALIVPEDATRDELLDLVKTVHQKDPESYYEVFDNTEELTAYIAWSKSENDPKVYFPEEWDMKHQVGMINQMLTENGMKWQFTSDKEKYLGTIDLE